MTVSIPPQPSPLVPGFVLDRYELLSLYAEGGMASVWTAQSRGKHGFERVVALKTILPKYSASSSFRDMFLDEARIAARIHHVNVAQVIDLGEQDGIMFLAMEWVDGDTLSKIERALAQEQKRLPLGIYLRILADACAGLCAAHSLVDEEGESLNVVHRDMSPQNLLVSTEGVTKVIDFGIAKAKHRFTAETKADVVKGKAQYMSPEQAQGKPVDARADLWAIGAMLYRYLTGKFPYHAKDSMEMLKLLLKGDAPAALPITVHPALAQIVRRTVAVDPDHRYDDAAQVQAALEDAMRAVGCVATSSDVASFLRDSLQERITTRRARVEEAVRHSARFRVAAKSGDHSAAAVGSAGAGDASKSSLSGIAVAEDSGHQRVPAKRAPEGPTFRPPASSVAEATSHTHPALSRRLVRSPGGIAFGVLVSVAVVAIAAASLTTRLKGASAQGAQHEDSTSVVHGAAMSGLELADGTGAISTVDGSRVKGAVDALKVTETPRAAAPNATATAPANPGALARSPSTTALAVAAPPAPVHPTKSKPSASGLAPTNRNAPAAKPRAEVDDGF